MFSWFRRRREARARALIRAELEQLAEYEQKHIARQAERLRRQQAKTDRPHRPLRPHGQYDPDQKREHVRIRLRGKVKPKLLEQLLRVEVPDEE